jgi:hypothetical protein
MAPGEQDFQGGLISGDKPPLIHFGVARLTGTVFSTIIGIKRKKESSYE